ncbi:hypothetical protein B0A49_07598 [Cryomyces minteri]|uniref:Uncharacterized protein n=1 Tax=Cryomyces minteri TaxID=331657 RepID=A0A4U0XE52_9PEZI|nr:hypothetical protein B0A49_07598 [Cryomyces minteri]
MASDAFLIQNPLAGIPHDTLVRNVDEFAATHGLADIASLLRKGALVAQDPPNYERVEDLNPTEMDALRNETLHKWRQPPALYTTVVMCSVGAAVQ